MTYHISYITKSANNEIEIKMNEKLLKKDFDVIYDCSQIIGKFNIFCDYYYMLENAINDLFNFIEKVENREYKLVNQLQKHFVVTEVNRLFMNYINMFNNYLTYYEVDIKDFFGETSDEYTKVKKIQSNFFDNYFEYRFIYHLRHYTDHYKIPITSMQDNMENLVRKFYITRESLLKWNGLKKIVKEDIKALTSDIDVKNLLIKCKKMHLEMHKKVSLIDEHNILFSYNYMKKYFKKDGFPCIVGYKNEEEKKNGKFEIKTIFDEVPLVGYNIKKMGFGSLASYKQGQGFFVYDPYNLMFTKEEKEKLGIE